MSLGQASVRDIAKAAGLSASTVSYALRNHPKISAPTREKVHRIAHELGYISDPQVSRLMEYLRKSRNNRPVSKLALVCPNESRDHPDDNSGTVFTEIEGAQDQAILNGYEIDVFWMKESRISLKRLRSILRSRGIEGVIIAPLREGAGHYDFDFDGFAASAMGYSMREPKLHRACAHHIQMMKGFMTDLINMGHRRVGIVLHPRYEDGSHNLLSASYLFIQSKLLPEDRIPILFDAESPKAFLAWMTQYSPEIVIGDLIHYKLLRDNGFRIPQDIGFANLDLIRPPINVAGLNHRYDLIGRAAVDLVVGQLSRSEKGVPRDAKVSMVNSGWIINNSIRKKSSHCEPVSVL